MSTRPVSLTLTLALVLALAVAGAGGLSGCGAPADVSLGPAGEPSGSRSAARLGFTIETDPAHAALAATYRDLFRGFGLNVKVKVVPWEDVLKRATTGEADACLLGWAGRTSLPLEMAVLKLATGGVLNGSGYANPELDLILAGQLARGSEAERTRMAEEAREMLNEEAPWVVGVTWPVFDVSASGLTGWIPGAAGAVSLHDAAAASGAAAAPGGDRSETVVALGVSRLPPVDPLRPIDPQCGALFRALFDALAAVGPDGQLVPELAESWELSPGGRRMRVTLREGVSFHDGSPLRSRDVVFTYREILPGRLPRGISVTVEAAGDREVLFGFSAPFPQFLELFGLQPVVPAAAYEAAGPDGFGLAPVGTGPFRWPQPGPGAGSERVTLTRWDGYYGGAPALPPSGRARLGTVMFRAVPELVDRLAMLGSGTVDLVPVVPAAEALTLGIEGAPRVMAEPGYSVVFLELNTCRRPFDDTRVRLALNHMIDPWLLGVDRAEGVELMTTLLEPEPTPAGGGSTVWSFDPDLARRLLSEAGYETTGP